MRQAAHAPADVITRAELDALVAELQASRAEQTAILRAILAELQSHRQRERPATLSRTDQDTLLRLLPAIAGALGSELFLVRELLAHSSAALRLVTAGTNPKALGRLLTRAKGIPIAGYVVSSEGEELGAALWRVRQAIL